MANLFEDKRCSKAVLWFLETTAVGKTVLKERPTEEDSDASVVDYASMWRPRHPSSAYRWLT